MKPFQRTTFELHDVMHFERCSDNQEQQLHGNKDEDEDKIEMFPLTGSFSEDSASCGIAILNEDHNGQWSKKTKNSHEGGQQKRAESILLYLSDTRAFHRARSQMNRHSLKKWIFISGLLLAWWSVIWNSRRHITNPESYQPHNQASNFPPRMINVDFVDVTMTNATNSTFIGQGQNSKLFPYPILLDFSNVTYLSKESVMAFTSALDTEEDNGFFFRSGLDWRHKGEKERAKKIAKGDVCELRPDYMKPNCHIMHETSLVEQYPFHKLGNGQKRVAYKLTVGGDKINTDAAFKSSSVKERSTQDTRHINQVDAMTAERLTSSPQVVNIYGYCGESQMLQLATNDFAHYVPKVSGTLSPKLMLEFARDASLSLAELQNITFPDFVPGKMIHRDIRPWNFLITMEGKLQLHDFNAGRFLPWVYDLPNETEISLTSNNNTHKEEANQETYESSPRLCHWQHGGKCNAYRSPEECIETHFLTEKTDVYNFGNFLFFLLTNGKMPYYDIKKKKSEINSRIRNGTLAILPNDIETSKDPAIAILRETRIKAQRFDPSDRPSAMELWKVLNTAYEDLYPLDYLSL